MSPILAPDHAGMRCNGRRILCEAGQGYTFMRREMARHLNELAERYYAGDTAAVDEFLQLYCFGEKQRKSLKLNLKE